LSYDLSFDEVTVAQKAFAFFLDPEFRENATSEIPEFRTLNIGEGMLIGMDKAVYDRLQNLQELKGADRSAEPVLSEMGTRQSLYKERRSEEISIGNDGVLLRDPHTPRRRRFGR